MFALFNCAILTILDINYRCLLKCRIKSACSAHWLRLANSDTAIFHGFPRPRIIRGTWRLRRIWSRTYSHFPKLRQRTRCGIFAPDHERPSISRLINTAIKTIYTAILTTLIWIKILAGIQLLFGNEFQLITNFLLVQKSLLSAYILNRPAASSEGTPFERCTSLFAVRYAKFSLLMCLMLHILLVYVILPVCRHNTTLNFLS